MQIMRTKTVTSLEGYALKSHILKKKILIRDKIGYPSVEVYPHGLCRLLTIPSIWFAVQIPKGGLI